MNPDWFADRIKGMHIRHFKPGRGADLGPRPAVFFDSNCAGPRRDGGGFSKKNCGEVDRRDSILGRAVNRTDAHVWATAFENLTREALSTPLLEVIGQLPVEIGDTAS